ncbi:PI-PLC X domain-containing protein 1 [Aplochiton taeniatus]
MEESEKKYLHVSNNADWMSQLAVELQTIPLSDLAIPGDHDSMSYCLDVNSRVLASEPLLLRALDRLAPCITRPCVVRWATTQAWPLSEQLNAGVRFFDLRIAQKAHRLDTLYFAHGVYTKVRVKEALSDMAAWLQLHPREVVVVVCSHFLGLEARDHGSLVALITALFAGQLCPYQAAPTLSSCWAMGWQVILSYDDEETVRQHQQLWPMIDYRYAQAADPVDVISYLEQQKAEGRPAGFFASGLNLTEDGAYVLCHPWQTMRTMTTRALAALLGWVEEQSPGPEAAGLNVICGDFVDLDRFASVVIGLNEKLLVKRRQVVGRGGGVGGGGGLRGLAP